MNGIDHVIGETDDITINSPSSDPQMEDIFSTNILKLFGVNTPTKPTPLNIKPLYLVEEVDKYIEERTLEAAEWNNHLLLERRSRGEYYWEPHTQTYMAYPSFKLTESPETRAQEFVLERLKMLTPPQLTEAHALLKEKNTKAASILRAYHSQSTDEHQKSSRGRKRRRTQQHPLSLLKEHVCGICKKEENDNSPFIICKECTWSYHPKCLEIEEGNVEKIRSFEWKCMHCKTCEKCKGAENEEQLLFCDDCDRGFHTFCLVPPLKELPEGSWHCPDCYNSTNKEENKEDNSNMEESKGDNSDDKRETKKVMMMTSWKNRLRRKGKVKRSS